MCVKEKVSDGLIAVGVVRVRGPLYFRAEPVLLLSQFGVCKLL